MYKHYGNSVGDNLKHVQITTKYRYSMMGKDKSPIIKGNNLSKFNYKIGYYVDDKFSDNKLDKLDRKKIILQNIFSSEGGIISTLDNEGFLTFDTITNIIRKDKRISDKYLFGLLNSKLINFYLMYAIFNKSKLTMHTDKAYIGKLPIVIASKDKQVKVAKIINNINKNKKNKMLLRELDKLVYSIYKINKEERHLIESSIDEMMSQKSRW